MPITNNKKPIKVTVLYSGGKSLSGIENYLINLFQNVDEDRIILELLSLGEWPLTKKLNSLKFKVKLFSSRRVCLKSIAKIGKYCIDNDIDLLVSQGTVANAYARLVSKLYKVINLVTVHSDASSEYPNTVVRGVYWAIDRLGRNATTSYVAVSNFIKLKLIKSGISVKKISVIYNGADYPKASARAHKRLVIGSLGRLDQIKGYDLLIRALSLIDNKRLRLQIAGIGAEKENLLKLAQDIGVVDRVEMVGYKTDIYKFLNSIDIYVQPSRSEGFGLSLVQAMSQNLPVVVTPAGSLPEIIKNGQTGYISKDLSPKSIADAISLAVKNIDESTKIGKNAGKYVNENFTTDKWIESTTKVFEDAVK